MRVAVETAGLSYATKLRVGAVAVIDRRIVCTGYNGTPAGESNQCEDFFDGKLNTRENVEHAERNLIYYATRKGIALEGASLFITHSPCIECARAIANVGFIEVYYQTLFNHEEGLKFLNDRVRVIQVHPTNYRNHK
jgi:dCMP deaminase